MNVHYPSTDSGSSQTHDSQSCTWWIDDQANWRLVTPESELPHLRDPVNHDPEALHFLYSWLGMIRVDKQSKVLTIEWDIQTVQPDSLAAAKTYLDSLHDQQHSIDEFVLHYCYGGWCRESFKASSNALARLEQTEAYRNVVPFEGPTIHPIELQTLDRDQLQSHLRRALDLWDEVINRPRGEALSLFFQHPELVERMVAYTRDSLGSLVYEHIGEESLFAKAYGHGETSQLIGQNCAFDPDHPTSKNPICEAYEAVLSSCQPRYDKLRTLYSRNEARYWISCERLLLPFTLAGGEQYLLAICCPLEMTAIPSPLHENGSDAGRSRSRTA
ncbi:MAG: hypothetical protein ACQETX_06285 [Pseudomonadota bacterium]|uniref:hypothetical protein n=1 Tax=Fodinicurvata fenggangensis TaxID=1121830 RepID=UPI00047CEEF2|nr:hypothetical protein [Fodinicurvata fenggangensis]